MANILNQIAAVFASVMGFIPDLFDLIAESDLLLLAVGLSVAGVVTGMALSIFKRV